jgi:hypothetical protein
MSSFTFHRPALLAGFIGLALSGCHKDKDPAPLTVAASSNTTATPTVIPLTFIPAPPTKALDPNYAFDLDNAQVMPSQAGAAAIPAPWAATAVGAYSADIRNDHKQADGWELLYTLFSADSAPNTNYFVTYNKYRGVMRLYYYLNQGVTGNTLAAYRALASSLYLRGRQAGTSPLFNFAGQSVIDMAKNADFVSSLDTQPLANGTWYITQYELAYDQNIVSKDYTTTAFTWQLNSSQLTGLSLNGVGLTSLPGSLYVDKVDFCHPGTIDYSLTYAGPAQLTLTGPASLTSLQQSGLPAEGARQVLALTAGAPWFRGQVPTQNAGLGATASLPVQAKFYTKADVGIAGPFLAFPGYDNSQVIGIAPQYNAAPGVFYLQSAPVITKQVLANGAQPYVYTLNVASVKYLFNPAVQALASIRNIQQEIVATAVDTGLDTTLYAGTTLAASQELTIQGVRVSFDVVPNNGSSPVHIVKTFKADVQ